MKKHGGPVELGRSSSLVQKRNKRIFRWSVAITAVICMASFALSFVALWDLAMGIGLERWITWLFPVFIDGLMIMATISMVNIASDHTKAGVKDRKFFRNVLIFGAAASIAGNAYHAFTNAPGGFHPVVAAMIASLAPISLLLASHGLVILNGRAREELKAAEELRAAEGSADLAASTSGSRIAAVEQVEWNRKVPPAVQAVAEPVAAVEVEQVEPVREVPPAVQAEEASAEADVVEFPASSGRWSKKAAEQRVKEALTVDSGVSVPELAAEIGWGESTVYRWAKRIRDEQELVSGAV